MYIVDDPLLALIAHFVTDVDKLNVADEDFLRYQVGVVKQYLEKYPADQQATKAREWICEHSKQYRQDWQRRMICERAPDKRCPDCPIVENGDSSQCEIHEQWVDLLKKYLDEEITSKKYVEDTLNLLNEHKSRLKVSALRNQE